MQKGTKHTKKTRKKISDAVKLAFKDGRRKPGTGRYNFIREIDIGVKYYDDKMAVASQMGYDSIHLAVKDLWENVGITQGQIADVFSVSTSAVQLMLKKAGTTKGGRRGGRHHRCNKYGLFIQTSTRHHFVSAYVKDADKWEYIKYKSLRCVECNTIISGDEWITLKHVFRLIDKHRDGECPWRGEPKSDNPYINERGIFNIKNSRYVAGYVNDNTFKTIRCVRCNEILSDDKWHNRKEVFSIIQNHVHERMHPRGGSNW